MDIKEAYELRRKENLSLRREVERLQKKITDALPAEEIEKREKRIRYLESIIKSKDKRFEKQNAKILKAKKRQEDLTDTIAELRDEVQKLSIALKEANKRADKAEAEVAELKGAKQKLEKKLNTNHENSSLPSSATPFGKKVANSRKKSGKKPGGQKGHKGHTISRLVTTGEPIHLAPPEEFLNDPDIYKTGKNITRQLIDIEIHVTVRDYVADVYRNRKTGTKLHAAFPADIVNPVNYGHSLKAFAFMLNNYYNISTEKTVQCILDMTNGVIKLSEGTIINVAKEFSTASEEERKKIFSDLSNAEALYSDATVSIVNGKRKAVILCTDKKKVLYQHFDHKGHDGLSKTPLMNFTGAVVHDHDRSYYSYGVSHQECLAHILRYLVGASEIEPELTWHKQMHDHIELMIHCFKKYNRKIPDSVKKELKQRYDEILMLAEEEYKDHPPKIFKEGFNLQKRLREFREAHLYFLDHPEIDPTNNLSERELRKFKRKQRQAVVFRSVAGGEHACEALTIIESLRMQGKNIFDEVKSYFAK